jgi:AraC-like DNA-binding protein
MPMAAEFRTTHFSTDETVPQDRLGVWREVIGRTVLRLDIEPLPDIPFEADVTLQALPGLAMLSGVISGSRSGRTRALLADGVDDFGLVVNLGGPYLISQGGRELVLGDGEATLFSCAEVNSFTHSPPGGVFAMRVPRTALAPFVTKIEDSFLRPIPSRTQALRLLTRYVGIVHVGIVRDELAAASPEMRHLVVAHVHDLLALTIGATGDAAEIARGRSVRAARQQAIKMDILQNLGRPDLSIAAVAARQGVTPRYVQMLFEADGRTFSEFVLSQRLARAHHMLRDPRMTSRTIAAIAFASGFGDLSYFNRKFRQRFGAAPSDLRSAALHGWTA